MVLGDEAFPRVHVKVRDLSIFRGTVLSNADDSHGENNRVTLLTVNVYLFI